MSSRWQLLSFFVLAYALSWATWIPMAVTGGRVVVGGTATHAPGLLGPMLAAVIVTGMADGRAGLRDLFDRMTRWRVGWGAAAIAVGSPIAFLAAALAVSAVMGRDLPSIADFGRFNGFPEVGPLGLWALLVLVGGFGEETGWRGFALPRLQRRFGALGGTLVLALFWALWHVPSFFVLETYRELGVAGMPGFLIGLACGAIVLAWIYARCRQSVLMVSLWHGTFNFASGTLAVRGFPAAIVTTLVMVWAVVIVIAEFRAHRHAASVLASPA